MMFLFPRPTSSESTALRRGFTLIETLVVIAVSGILMLAVSEILVLLIQQSPQRLAVLSSTDQVRLAGMRFANEVRDGQFGLDGSYPLGEASDTEIVIYSPYDAPATTTVRRIRYFLSDGTLYRGITTASGNPADYDLGTETVTAVVSNVLSSTTPLFTYYNGEYAGTSSPMAQPVNVTQVTYARMNLSIGQKQTRNATSTFSFTAGAAIRSLKINLGN